MTPSSSTRPVPKDADYARFAVALVVSIAVAVASIVGIMEVFHRYVVIAGDPSRINLEVYLANSDHIDVVALGSSQTNMSLNISDSRFYNLAWRGESVSQTYERLAILLREAKHLPCRIVLEANAPLINSSGTTNPLYYFGDHVTSDDLSTFTDSAVEFHFPLLSQFGSNYQRDLPVLLKKYLRGEQVAATFDTLHFAWLPNGFSYNVIPSKEFSAMVKSGNRLTKGQTQLEVNKNYDYFFTRVIELAQRNGIQVDLMKTPFHPLLREILEGQVSANVDQYVSGIARKYGLKVFDYSHFSDDPRYFWNEDHMNLQGATAFGKFAAGTLMSTKSCLRESRSLAD
jgi:hypothetical protein